MTPLEMLAKVAQETWVRENSLKRSNRNCGKRKRKQQGFYARLAAASPKADKEYPKYEEMQKSFRTARDLILLL